jgi:hypothetical protein
MPEFTPTYPVLVALRRARPAGPVRSPEDPEAAALFERIVSSDGRDPERPEARVEPDARRRSRTRSARPVRRAVVGSAAALAVVGLVTGLVITSPAGRGPVRRDGLGIQILAERTKAALTAAVGQDVEYLQTRTTGQTAASRTVDQWSYGTAINTETFDAHGSPFDDVWYTGSCGAPTATAVEVLYPIRSWWTRTVTVIVTPQVAEVTGRDVAGRIQRWVSAGQLAVVGTPAIDGRATIEVSGNGLTLWRSACTGSASGPPAAPADGPLRFDLTMWLDPSTYLPVKLNTTMFTATDPGTTLSTTSTVSWLPATPANTSKLEGQIPRGFTHLAGPPTVATGTLATTPS